MADAVTGLASARKLAAYIAGRLHESGAMTRAQAAAYLCERLGKPEGFRISDLDRDECALVAQACVEYWGRRCGMTTPSSNA